MKVIFLDIDGVLNYHGAVTRFSNNMYFVEDEKLILLKKIVDETGAEIVLSSTWRAGWNLTMGNQTTPKRDLDDAKDYFMLCAKLHDYGLSLMSEIPRLQDGNREDAINYWLDEWPGRKISNYVILDDEKTRFYDDTPNLVLTSADTGLMEADVEQAIHILNDEQEKTKPRILIVDDIELNRMVLSIALEDDYDILQAENGKEALSILAKNPDIRGVITDIQMPKMNGMELIQSIRSKTEYNNIAIVANTQFGDMNQEEQLIELGADEFVYRPSSVKIIQMRIRNVLRRGK